MMNTEIKKVCTKCGEEKALDEFNRQKLGKHGRRATCKECRKEERLLNKEYHTAYKKEYYSKEENKARKKETDKRWREKNRDRKREIDKAYRDKQDKNKVAEYNREYRRINKEELALKKKAYYEANKEMFASKSKQWYKANKQKVITRSREHYKANKESCLAKKKEYHKKRYAEDPVYRTMMALRKQAGRLGNYKSKTTIQIVGCSPQEFWRRNGSPSVEQLQDLHVDHIIPLSWFDLSNEDHVAVSSHHSNLQYLNTEDNLSKGSSYAGSPDNIIAYKDDFDIEAYVTEMIALINIL